MHLDEHINKQVFSINICKRSHLLIYWKISPQDQ